MSKRRNTVWRDSYGFLRVGWVCAMLTSLVLLGAAALVGIIGFGMYHADKASCAGFAEVSEREVRFERYWFGDWDCLVETSDGWVPRDAIRKVED